MTDFSARLVKSEFRAWLEARRRENPHAPVGFNRDSSLDPIKMFSGKGLDERRYVVPGWVDRFVWNIDEIGLDRGYTSVPIYPKGALAALDMPRYRRS